MMLMTQESLRQFVEYDPEAGTFTYLKRSRSDLAVGVAAVVKQGAYTRVTIKGKRYRACRLAWLYMTGSWPAHEIDHINGERHDDRFVNLRDVPRAVNQQNRRTAARSNKASGLLGAHRNKNGWAAHIHVGGRTRHIGQFRTPEEAHEAYIAAKRELHKGCTL
jgi:hypothetical protein